MRLGVDASRAVGNATGVGRYVEYMLREWSRMELPFERVHVFSHRPTGVVPNDDRFSEEVLPGRPGIRWQQARLARAGGDIDVLFAPYTTPVGFRRLTVVANLGIYEGELAIPGFRSRLQSRHYARSARSAAAVVANSAATGRELQHRYGVDPAKVAVIWPGVDERFRPAGPADAAGDAQAVVDALGSDGPYVLYVGKLSARRNLPEVVRALALVRAAVPGLRLLVVGPDTSGVDVPTLATSLDLGDAVVHLDHVEQDRLARLYRRAEAFVLPTLAEGFSFTIPEALASGAPVVTVRHDALVEAGLEHEVVALPSPDAPLIASSLIELLGDPALAAARRKAGPEAVARLSWAENARLTMELIAGSAEA